MYKTMRAILNIEDLVVWLELTHTCKHKLKYGEFDSFVLNSGCF